MQNEWTVCQPVPRKLTSVLKQSIPSPCQCPKKPRLAAGRAEAQEETKPIQYQLRSQKINAKVVRAAG